MTRADERLQDPRRFWVAVGREGTAFLMVSSAFLFVCLRGSLSGVAPGGGQKVWQPYVVRDTVALWSQPSGGELMATLVPGQVVVTMAPESASGWQSVLAAVAGEWSRGTILGAPWAEGWIEAARLQPLELPRLGVALHASMPQDERTAKCVYSGIEPGDVRYLREVREDPLWGPTAVYVDDGCWQSAGSESLFEIEWALAPLLAFRILPASARACASLYDSLPTTVRGALSERWPVLPASCEVYEVRDAPDLFPGEHTVVQTGAFLLFDLPGGVEDNALTPALVVDGTVMVWNEVMFEGAFRPFQFDADDEPRYETQIIRETATYTLIAQTWTDQEAYRHLEILRGSSNPYRLQSVFTEEWSVMGPPEDYPGLILQPDGTVRREGDRVCEYDENAEAYVCRELG